MKILCLVRSGNKLVCDSCGESVEEMRVEVKAVMKLTMDNNPEDDILMEFVYELDWNPIKQTLICPCGARMEKKVEWLDGHCFYTFRRNTLSTLVNTGD